MSQGIGLGLRVCRRLLATAGFAPALAATGARLLYWTCLGAASSRSRRAGEPLDRMVAEIKRIELGKLPPAIGRPAEDGKDAITFAG